MIYNGKLIKNSEGISPQSTIMFCFPYAGGGTAFYAKWIQYFDKKLSVCPCLLYTSFTASDKIKPIEGVCTDKPNPKNVMAAS